jgi:hypothetical protein
MIVGLLGEEAKPISLSELMEKLHFPITERTARRWLKELVYRGFLLKSGVTKSAKYTASKPYRAQIPHEPVFDEVRILYRAQRRNVIREIILNGLIEEKLKSFVEVMSNALIPPQDRKRFQENVFEDLAYLDEISIVGLGITREELAAWSRKFRGT